MFGDVGHAIILIAFGLYLVVTEEKTAAKKNHNEIFNIFFAGRYVILLMGLFSLYTGLIYNDVFSKSVNIFGSSWHAPTNTSMLTDNSEINLDPDQQYSDAPYVFGVDPVWGGNTPSILLSLNTIFMIQVSTNRIVFLNSYKMKISIVLGVLHMILGLCINVVNFV
jgi:V-type H+-transporting ATPase subunit a